MGHRGGYAYRLCQVNNGEPWKVNEKCFQNGHLNFHGDTTWIYDAPFPGGFNPENWIAQPKKLQELEQLLQDLNGPKSICQEKMPKKMNGQSRIWLMFQKILHLDNMYCLLDGILREHHKFGMLVPILR